MAVIVISASVYKGIRDRGCQDRQGSNEFSVIFLGIASSIVLIYIGWSIDSKLNVPSLTTGYGQFECVVTEASYDISGGLGLTVKLSSGALAKVSFYKHIPSDIGTGDHLLISGKLKDPETAGNPGEFDYRKYLKSKGILYQISCDECVILKKAGFPNALWGNLQSVFFSLRKVSVQALSGSGDEELKALISAVCIGDKSLLTNDIKRDFKLSCCSHLLAVSGTHFAGFLAGLPFVLEKLKVKRKPALLIYSVFAIFTGSLTGWGDSVTRAAFMSICLFAMREWVSAICLAAVVMILSDPFSPLSSGFQMSFCAVIAIKVYGRRISGFLERTGAGKKLSAVITPAISASLGMIPFWTDISMRPDPEHLLLQISASFFAQTACTFFVPCVVLCLILPFWSALLSSPVNLCLRALIGIVSFGSKLTEKSSAFIHLSKAFLVLFAAVLFVYMLPSCVIRRFLIRPVALMLAVIVGFEAFSFIRRPDCTVVFADVGQGDCCLIITPNSTCLIDAGTYGEGASTVVDLLDYYGISQVDVCIMSHWDVDHAGGIAALFERGRTAYILTSYVPGEFDTDKDAEEFFKALSFTETQKNEYLSRLDLILAGDRIWLSDNVYLDILYPCEASGGGNENSMVIMLHIETFKAKTILLTGDIGENVESTLIEDGIDIDCDILKVAHHGSKYSSSEIFLNACSPEIAVISVGKNNFYGHPAPDTMERLENCGCEVFRTDEDGAVILEYY